MSRPLGLLELADDHGYLTLRDVDLGIDWSKRGIHHNGWERTLGHDARISRAGASAEITGPMLPHDAGLGMDLGL
jgi:hypothetical protein